MMKIDEWFVSGLAVCLRGDEKGFTLILEGFHIG